MQKKSIWTLMLLSAVCWITGMPQHSSAQMPQSTGPLDNVLVGKWTYRSFNNEPNLNTPVGDILFGEGTLTIAHAAGGKLEGNFDFGPGYGMKLIGTVSYGNPATLQFEAKGTGPNNLDWRYDYVAYLGFQFPQGVNQRPSLVGTIVRAQPHSEGKAPAGVTASWIAVKQDMVPAAPLAMQGPNAPAAVGKQGGGMKFLKAAAPAGAKPVTSGGLPLVHKSNSPKVLKKYLDDAERRAENPLPESTPKVIESPRPSSGATGAKPGAKPLLKAAPQALAAVPARQPSLQPETVTSQNGVLKLDLVVDYNKDPLTIGKDQVHLRTYNGKLVGPVLRAKAGDTLSITVHNNLPDVPPPSPGFMNGHHDWNVTNLHFHGLHVAPQGTPDAESDNVLLEILPGKSQHYEVHIPKDHPAGTFWYHAHRHGSTAADVASGMAGALIVERTDNTTNLDSIPEVAAAAQEVMVLQAVPYVKNPTTGIGEIELQYVNDVLFGPGDFFTLKRYTTVNGLKIPTITLAPGEVRRLRLVASGQREFVQLRIARDPEGNVPDADQIPFHEVAVDGLVTGRLSQVQDLILHPGYRSDALIQPGPKASGTYYLVDMNSVFNAGTPDDPKPTGADGSPERISIIAMIQIAGEPVDMKLPDSATLLTQRLPDLQVSPDAEVNQRAYYGIQLGSGTVEYFLSNSEKEIPPGTKGLTSREFNPDETRYLPLGHTEKWQVGSRNSGTIPAAHPFHIHINPFLITGVVDDQGADVLLKEFGGSVWRDTLAMKQNYTYTLLTKYERYTGRYVNHCHILDHEDNGMMEIVEVYDPAKTKPRSSPLGVAGVSGAIPEVLKATPGRPMLAVVLRSLDCGLCREQIEAFEKATQAGIWPKSLDLVFVTPDSANRLAAAQTEGLVKTGRLVSDTNNTTLISIDPKAMIDERDHGILLLDQNGNTLFKSASLEPLLDPVALKPHLDLLLANAGAGRAESASLAKAAIDSRRQDSAATSRQVRP